MIIVTSQNIAGKQIVETLGLVRGNSIRARHIGRDITAAFKNIAGGEIEEYTKLMGEAREQAIDRMVNEAKQLNANAIVDVRLTTSYVTSQAAEVLAYGTAVKLK